MAIRHYLFCFWVDHWTQKPILEAFICEIDADGLAGHILRHSEVDETDEHAEVIFAKALAECSFSQTKKGVKGFGGVISAFRCTVRVQGGLHEFRLVRLEGRRMNTKEITISRMSVLGMTASLFRFWQRGPERGM
jgi:hypothetical protein